MIGPTGLTDIGKKEIRQWLTSYKPDKVEAFLRELDPCLIDVIQILDCRKTYIPSIEYKKNILKALKKVIQKVETMYDKDIMGRPVEHMARIVFLQATPQWRPLYEIKTRLEKEISEQAKPGRPREFISYLEWDITFEIARLFAKYIEKPAFYRDGPFYNVVRLAFKFLELPNKAPDRSIKAVLKALNVDPIVLREKR